MLFKSLGIKYHIEQAKFTVQQQKIHQMLIDNKKTVQDDAFSFLTFNCKK